MCVLGVPHTLGIIISAEVEVGHGVAYPCCLPRWYDQAVYYTSACLAPVHVGTVVACDATQLVTLGSYPLVKNMPVHV